MTPDRLPLDLARLVRTLNALAGVAGGIATPAGAQALSASFGRPESEAQLTRWAANLSGLAWAGASLLDLVLLLNERVPATSATYTSPTDAQLALWRRLRDSATAEDRR